MKKILILIISVTIAAQVSADEGMWLLKELNKQSVSRMQELGFRFPIDSLYSETNPSLKDAVVIFGGGCTGVAVSKEGLIFTNHHCGYDAIQKHSSVEHDYLKNGFVSQSKEEELYTEGLQVHFLKKTEDITSRVLKGLAPEEDEDKRVHHIDSISKNILDEYKDNEFLSARIVPFYGGNKYYLIVYDVFKDIRMVFAPPSSVGKFGGETDNWMWPRHTGDFSVFRVYANENNEAAGYSVDNVPYRPKYFVPVSLKGYAAEDYAMTIGYPGTTNRYLSSWGIRQRIESENKPRIEVRGVKQDIWREAMNADDAVRIKYATKYARSSNYWKNSIGMNAALAKLNVIEEKEKQEARFNAWLDSNKDAKQKYGSVLPTLQNAYASSMELVKSETYYSETFTNGIEIIKFAKAALALTGTPEEKGESFKEKMTRDYKDYEAGLDKKTTSALLKLYAEKIPRPYLPEFYNTIQDKYKGDYEKFTEWVFKNSKFTSLDEAVKLIKEGNSKDFEKDPAIILAKAAEDHSILIRENLGSLNNSINAASRLYIAGLMEMEPQKAFSPDANFTQRLSYGFIGGYKPADAICYDYYSTTQGILEKENPSHPEFAVQQYILDNIMSKNWGQYADKTRNMFVNFLSNNDITGGNSGSPVFNGDAELIGLAFDGNWEALSGDLIFEQQLQRCINVDIRYVLYMIEKVGKCPRLIQELQIEK